MKKIFTLIILMLAVVSVQAKTDKKYSTGLTDKATNATITDTWTLGWTSNTSNSARAFSGLSSTISNYKKLHIKVASSSESTSYRVILYCNSRTTTNAYAGTYTGSTTITLADLTYTTTAYDNHGYDDINIVCVAGSGNEGSVTFKEIYLETEEYECMDITTTLNSSSTKTSPFAWYDYSSTSTAYSGTVNNNIASATALGQNTIVMGPQSANATTAFFDVTGYNNAKITLSQAGDAGIRFMYDSSTLTVNTSTSATEYTQDISTMSKIATIKTKNVTVSNAIKVSSIDFVKEFKAASTTAFNIAASKSSTVEYDRSFTKDQAATVCLPFALSTTEVSAISGKFYELKSGSGDALTFDEVTETAAYKPYLFVPSADGKPFASLASKEIVASEGATLTTTVGSGTYTMTGTLARQTAPDGCYGWSATDGKFVKVSGSGVSISAFRAYVTTTSSARSLDVTFNDNNPTGISEVRSRQEQRTVMYNLAGQRVGEGHRGLVIVNGKKVVMK